MVMDNTEDVTFEVEGRTYVNPQVALNEREQFVDTLRNVQAENTAQINQNTYNLGSQVPSNIGGLGGSEGLWTAQYQTPQVDAQIANLRATAQQEALNTALSNLQNIYQNRYKQAYRGAKRRAKANSAAGNPATTPLQLPNPDVDTKNPEQTGEGTTLEEDVLTTGDNLPAGTTVWKDENGYYHTQDLSTGKQIDSNDPTWQYAQTKHPSYGDLTSLKYITGIVR